MSKSLTLLVQIQAKPAAAEQVKAALLAILAPTRAEAGCENYQFHVCDTDPSLFIFVETWTSRAHWEAHNASPHLAEFLALAETAVEKFTLTEMTELGA